MINIPGLINKINLMPNSKNKAMKIALLYAHLNFLVDIHKLERKDIIDIVSNLNESDIFIKHLISDEKYQVNSIIDSCEHLTSMYEEVLNYANLHQLYNVSVPHANIKELLKYAIEFLNYIDPKALELFNKLLCEGLVYEGDLENCGGKCHKFYDDTSGIIIRYDTLAFYKAMTTLHEIGHAYYNYLDKTSPNLTRTNIASECIPRVFEQLFLLYLKRNHLINRNDIEKYERFFLIHQLNITNSVYVVNTLLLNDIISSDFFIENIKADISFDDYYDLSIVKPKDDSFQNLISFENNYYSYAFLFSMVIRERFLEDEKETLKFIKNIPYYSRQLNNLEFINLFSEEEYLWATETNIDRILFKKYYKK